jgi:hypothetical protein
MIRPYREQHRFGATSILYAVLFPHLKPVLIPAVFYMVPKEIAKHYMAIIEELTDEGQLTVPAEKAKALMDLWGVLRNYYPHVERRKDFDQLLDLVWRLCSDINREARECKLPQEVQRFTQQMTSYQMVETIAINELAQTFVQDRMQRAVRGSFTMEETEDGDEEAVVAVRVKRSQVVAFSEFIRSSIVNGVFFEQDFINKKFEITDDGILPVSKYENEEEADTSPVLEGEEWAEVFGEDSDVAH